MNKIQTTSEAGSSEEVLDYDKERDGDQWQGYRRFPDGQILNAKGFDQDRNRREYW